jgi:hypothetical protein
MALPRSVKIVEVGPRDGLQNEKQAIPTYVKVGLVVTWVHSFVTNTVRSSPAALRLCLRVRAIGRVRADGAEHGDPPHLRQDKTKTYCVHDAPSPEAIRQAARKLDLPVESITQVTALDPYFYH